MMSVSDEKSRATCWRVTDCGPNTVNVNFHKKYDSPKYKEFQITPAEAKQLREDLGHLLVDMGVL